MWWVGGFASTASLVCFIYNFASCMLFACFCFTFWDDLTASLTEGETTNAGDWLSRDHICQLLEFSELPPVHLFSQSVLRNLYFFPHVTNLLRHFVPRRWCSDSFLPCFLRGTFGWICEDILHTNLCVRYRRCLHKSSFPFHIVFSVCYCFFLAWCIMTLYQRSSLRIRVFFPLPMLLLLWVNRVRTWLDPPIANFFFVLRVRMYLHIFCLWS